MSQSTKSLSMDSIDSADSLLSSIVACDRNSNSEVKLQTDK